VEVYSWLAGDTMQQASQVPGLLQNTGACLPYIMSSC